MVGDRIKYLRELRGLSQTELAKIMGVGKSTLSYYESNMRSPDYATLLRFVEFFGCSADFLLGLTDEINYDGINLKKEMKKYGLSNLSDEEFEKVIAIAKIAMNKGNKKKIEGED